MQTTQSTSVSAKIRGIAAENRATQEDIAKIAGVSRAAIVRRLNGSTDWQALELIALAKAFNVPAGAFFPPVDTASPAVSTGVSSALKRAS